ncbi:MAG TPA: FixH family protein, partial [Polyangiaceae bacterium]|nr:FixH family protein [Polyangiaceae bacterium]
MKFAEKLSKHRHKIVPAVALSIIVLAALGFRPELTAWFSGRPLPTASTPGAGTKLDVGPYAVAVGFSPDPPKQKGNTLIVEVRDKKDQLVAGADVFLRYRMPPMGSMQEMKGEADVTAPGDGQYEAKFDLPMRGSWELTLGIKKGGQGGEGVFNMTVGVSGLTVSGQGATGSELAASESLPTHAFDKQTVERLRAAFGAYEQVRALLAKDSTEGLDAQSKQVAGALDASAKEATGIPKPISAALRRASEAASELGKAADPDAAHKPFGELSRELVALAGADPRLSEGLHIFKCPMAEGFQKWFQPSPRLENPYMGQKMPECGVRSKWQQAAADEVHAHESAPPGGDDEISHYTCSMHPSVKQDGPGKCPICAMDLTPVTKQEVETGTIFVDEIRRQRIGVRTDIVKRRQMTLQVRAVGGVRYDES